MAHLAWAASCPGSLPADLRSGPHTAFPGAHSFPQVPPFLGEAWREAEAGDPFSLRSTPPPSPVPRHPRAPVSTHGLPALLDRVEWCRLPPRGAWWAATSSVCLCSTQGASASSALLVSGVWTSDGRLCHAGSALIWSDSRRSNRSKAIVFGWFP